MKLALNGQWKELSGLIYTYPDKISGIPEWAISLPDPRNVRGLFKGDYCYALWYNSNGYYYACTKTNTDSRNGCVMLTLFAEKNVPLDGKKLAEKMRLLLDYCLSKNDVSEIAYVDFSIRAKEIEGLLVTRKLPKEMSSPQDNDLAYRLYSNEDELGLILENPNQPNYVGYKRVLVIDGQQFVAEALNAQSITKITEAVKKTYDIRRDSNDVSADKESVMDGETFTITYRKKGFIDASFEVVAGKVSPFYTIDGNVINLRSAVDVGVVFSREIVLQVFDEETNRPIKEWSYKIDGGKWIVVQKEDAAKGIRLPLEPNKSYKLVATAEGYEAKSVEIASGDYGIKKIHLHSLDESVFVRLQIGEKEYSDSVRMKSNNMLYYPLKRLDQNNRVLQVKRPFFSRRNLVPIISLFILSLLIGGVLGRLVIKGGKTDTATAPIDTSEYKTLCDDYNAKVEQLRIVNDEKEFLSLLLGKYATTLNFVKDKIQTNQKAVNEILNKPDYNNLLEGTEKDTTVFNAIITELTNITKENNSNNNNGNSGNNGNNSNSAAAQLQELLSNNEWKLNEISGLNLSDNDKGEIFVNKIKNGDIETLHDGGGVYKMARDNNGTWNNIIDEAYKLTDEKKKAFASHMQSESRDNVLNLMNLRNYLNEE